MSVTYEIIAGKRNNSKLLYIFFEKQLYIKKCTKLEKHFYVCYVKDCPSRIMLFGSECIKAKNYKAHNHDNQEALYKELKFLNNVKTKCTRLNEKPTENNCAGSIRNIFVNTSME